MCRPTTKVSVLGLYCTRHRCQNKVMRKWNVQRLDVGIQSLIMVTSLVHASQLSVVCALFATTNKHWGRKRYVIVHVNAIRPTLCRWRDTGVDWRNLQRVTPTEKAQMLSVVNTITTKHSLGLQWRNLYWTVIEISFNCVTWKLKISVGLFACKR